MNNLKTIDSKILLILRECPEARYDDMLLILKYYTRFSDLPIGRISFEEVIRNYKAFGLPCFESIRRVRQRVQSLFPELSREKQCDGCDGGVTIVIQV